MSNRFAMFFACDDVLVSLNGKYAISGMYTGDIVIPKEKTTLPQLVVMFEVQTQVEDPFRSFIVYVSLPGESVPRQLDLSKTIPTANFLGRSAVTFRYPFLIQSPVLCSGPIEAKIIHEAGELSAGKLWVVTTAQAEANLALIQT